MKGRTDFKGFPSGKLGRSFLYTDGFMLHLFQIKCVFDLGHRQLEGFVDSLISIIKIYLSKKINLVIKAPGFSTIQKMIKKIDIKPSVFIRKIVGIL